MNQPADYIVVVCDNEDITTGCHLFAQKVNQKLKAGYQLHGQPVSVERMLCQAMIKVLPPEGGQKPHSAADRQ